MKKMMPILLGIGLLMVTLLVVRWGSTAVSAQQIQSTNAGTPVLTATQFATGFTSPVAIANAGDSRLFIVEKPGTIKILNANGTTVGTLFLDITDRVRNLAEQGLLGLAFDPDYDTNGYFYVNYSYCDGSSCGAYSATTDLYTRISRFTVTANANIADPSSELIMLTVQQPYGNHNGGDLQFGPDGYLYIGFGDGGNGDDPQNHGQTTTDLLGAMLRIDVDPAGGNAPDCGGGSNYSIPIDNPFVSDADSKCDEIWASGLRNPWRYSFDRSTGDLFIADVGQDAREEVNFQLASSNGGENYGWRCYEGTIETPGVSRAGCLSAGNYDMPFYEYSHTNGNHSITGGFVYRGAQYTTLRGHYIFADYASGNFWVAQNSGGTWSTTSIGTVSGIRDISSFGEDCRGELYVADLADGEIFKLGTSDPQPTPSNFVYLPMIISGSGVSVLGCS